MPDAPETHRASSTQAADQLRRKAALCVERSLEHYSEGRYAECLGELEAALVAQPNHARAGEFLAWVKEVTSGRHVLTSGSFTTVADEGDVDGESVEGAPRKKGGTLLGLPALERMTGEIGDAALAAVEAEIHAQVVSAPVVSAPPTGSAPPTVSQVDETPDSVTREWSTAFETSNAAALENTELSDEQIANLLDAEAGRGLTLSKHAALPGVTARSASKLRAQSTEAIDADADDAEEVESTGVRFAEQVVEIVADSEDDEEQAPSITVEQPPDLDPFLTPLESAEERRRAPDQTADDASSMPTNPFVEQRLREIAPAFFATPGVDELPGAPGAGWPSVRAAIDRGIGRAAFDVVERAIQAQGGVEHVSGEEEQIASRAYELYLGDLQAVPRFGKTTPDLDSRSAFLLSRIDGTTCADDLLDVSGMPRLEALRVLARLVAGGVVVLKK